MKEFQILGDDRVQVVKAVDLTRRMRMAALYPTETSDSVADVHPPFEDAQEVLKDAEELALFTSQLVVSLTSSHSQQVQRDRLRDANVGFEGKYGEYEKYIWTDSTEEGSVNQLQALAIMRQVLGAWGRSHI